MSQEPANSEAPKPGCLATMIGAVILLVLAIVLKLILWRLFG